MNRFSFDPAAKSDLKDILAYIHKDNPAAAHRLFGRFNKTFRLIAKQPLLGEKRAEILADLRSFSVGNYVIYFRPNEVGVDIIRILHGARDVESMFD